MLGGDEGCRPDSPLELCYSTVPAGVHAPVPRASNPPGDPHQRNQAFLQEVWSYMEYKTYTPGSPVVNWGEKADRLIEEHAQRMNPNS